VVVERVDLAGVQLLGERFEGADPVRGSGRVPRQDHPLDDPLGRFDRDPAGGDVDLVPGGRGAQFVRTLPAGPAAVPRRPAPRVDRDLGAAPSARHMDDPVRPAGRRRRRDRVVVVHTLHRSSVTDEKRALVVPEV